MRAGLLLFFWVLSSSLTAQIHDSLNALACRHGVVGVSLALVEGNKVSAFHAGLRDLERELPVTDETLFRVASISKLAALTGLMLLWDKQKFDLDDDVSGYLGFPLRNPAFPNAKITFRMLASHTSSLAEGGAYDRFLTDTYEATQPVPVSELFTPGGSYFSEDIWLPHAPGTYFRYSNVNFGLIGTLIEILSGERFDRYLRAQVLSPLGMSGSYAVSDLHPIDHLAVLYRKSNHWTPTADSYRGIQPAPRNLADYTPGTNGFLFGPQGGLRASVFDLSRLMQLHLNDGKLNGKRILSKKAVRRMRSPQWTSDGQNGDTYNNLFTCWGLGVQIFQNTPQGDVVWPGRAIYGHLGEAYGLLSGFFFDPKGKQGFIFALNGLTDFLPGESSALYKVEEDLIRLAKMELTGP